VGHPLIDEFCRVAGVHQCQPQFFNRMQRELRDQVQPLLNERESLLIENAQLRDQLAKAKPKRETVPA
jgi:regulator of replication initiation timing